MSERRAVLEYLAPMIRGDIGWLSAIPLSARFDGDRNMRLLGIRSYIDRLESLNADLVHVLRSVKVPKLPPLITEYITGSEYPVDCVEYTTLDEMREYIAELEARVANDGTP